MYYFYSMTAAQEEELLYQMALMQIDRIGYRSARMLMETFGSAKAIFHSSAKTLRTMQGLGSTRAASLACAPSLHTLEKELAFIKEHQILPLCLADERYPARLKECPDAPLLLFYRGQASLNGKKMIAVIGSRQNTEYGARATEELVEGLREQDITIVSGLAGGIDGIAHRKALQTGSATIGVMAHGHATIYPRHHRDMAAEMIQKGGLLTEHLPGTPPERHYFPVRNRIVAGLCDVTVVVETAQKGGAMITAKLATGYNREVAAFPGRSIDKKSEGCNYLIKTGMAQLITRAADLLDMMNWQTATPARRTAQPKLFEHFTPEETKVASLLKDTDGTHIDELSLKTGWNTARLFHLLLTLELAGAVDALPGKRFRLSCTP